MRMNTGFALIGGVASVIASQAACLYPERNVQAFDPKTELGISTGRLWVMPNPVHLTFETLSPGSLVCKDVEITNIGTEPLVVTEIVVEGAPAFSRPFDGYLPLTLEPQHNVHGSPLCWTESAAAPREGALIFATDDPVAPVVRVPIIVEQGAAPDPSHLERPVLGTTPNPIRLIDVSEGDLLRVLLACSVCTEEHWLRFDDVSSDGYLVEVTGLRSTTEGEAALTLPVKYTVSTNPGEAAYALDLIVISPDPGILRDTVTLRVSNSFGERYQIGIPVLRE